MRDLTAHTTISLPHAEDRVNWMGVSRDERLLLVGEWGGAIRIVDLESRTVIASLRGRAAA